MKLSPPSSRLFAIAAASSMLAGGADVAGFQPAGRRRAAVGSLRMGLLDDLFKPVHGHPGKLHEEDLDELYKDQQQLQSARKARHLDKPHLKAKYGKMNKKGENWLEKMLHPMHGSGSLHDEQDIEDMYEAQQQILYMRREYGKNHDKLKQKYYHKTPEQQENDRHVHNVEWEKSHRRGDPKLLNQKEDDAMYVDEEGDGGGNPFLGLKMPWGNLKP